MTVSYTSAASHTSGTLTVVSAGGTAAAIELIGTYSPGEFKLTSGIGGTVEITDPAVINGGGIPLRSAQPSPQQGTDLPNFSSWAQTTLAYAEDNTDTGGSLQVTDGRHAAAVALLGNYMAGSFVSPCDGHGTLDTEAQPQQQPLLAHPRT